MNLNSISTEKKVNTRKPNPDFKGNPAGKSEKKYDLLYRVSVDKENKRAAKFKFSKKFFDATALALHSLVQVNDEHSTGLAFVGNDEGMFLKGHANAEGTKGRAFTNNTLEARLSDLGIIDKAIVGKNQYIKLSLVEGSQGFKVGKATATGGIYALAVDAEANQEAPKTEVKESAPANSELTQESTSPAASTEPVKEEDY